jgi:hypothetical protein
MRTNTSLFVEQLTLVVFNPCLLQHSTTSLDEQRFVSRDFSPSFEVTINVSDRQVKQFTNQTFQLRDDSNGVDCGPVAFEVAVESMPPWFKDLFTVDTKNHQIIATAPKTPLPSSKLEGFLLLKVKLLNYPQITTEFEYDVTIFNDPAPM